MNTNDVLVVGSAAWRHQGALTSREVKDFDLISSFDGALEFLKQAKAVNVHPVNEGKKLIGFMPKNNREKGYDPVEIEITWAGSTARELMELVWDDSKELALGLRTAPLDALYALKMSHRYKRNSPHFTKTMLDIHAMRKQGAKIPDSLKDWFLRREKETYDYKHPSLNVGKKEFFANDGIKYKYDHDSLHMAIKRDERPAYEYFKPDTKEVFCSKEMFEACPRQTRLNAVYEESAVLAVERSIVAHPGVLTAEQAFAKALEKVSSSITSGWFREFAWENYGSVLALYEEECLRGRGYVKLFEDGLASGVVKEL